MVIVIVPHHTGARRRTHVYPMTVLIWSVDSQKNKKAELSHDDRAMSLFMCALKIFDSPTATFIAILMGFCSDRSYECGYKIGSS